MQIDKSNLADSIAKSIENLASMTDATAKSETFKTWLRAVSRFHDYSFGNSMLILLQRGDATRVAGFNTWKSLGRHVKKGAKGIATLAPCISKRKTDDDTTGDTVEVARLRGFRVAHVFDIADTEGEEIPELQYRATEGGEELLPKLEAAARRLKINLEYRDNTGQPRGWSEGGQVVVNSSLTTVERCGTLAHELAHEVLHWQLSRRGITSREQRELEAEATSYALLAQFGIEQPSQNYLASWSANAETITASLNMIRMAVHTIMAAMEETNEDAASEKLAA